MDRRLGTLLAALAFVCGAAACSSSGSGSSSASPSAGATTTGGGPAHLTVVVTNDDGIKAPGIATVAQAIDAMENVDVIAVAPKDNQSGTGDKTTPGGAGSGNSHAIDGVPGVAVDGTPADSVNVALDDLHLAPNLVVSGINRGQNVGPNTEISGTVGAALTAARRGVPAVAGSAGFAEDADYRGAATLIVAWITAHRAALAAHKLPTKTIVNFNVPQCTKGQPRALAQVPLATSIPEGASPYTADCSIPSSTEPTNDVDAIAHGYPAQTDVPVSAKAAN